MPHDSPGRFERLRYLRMASVQLRTTVSGAAPLDFSVVRPSLVTA